MVKLTDSAVYIRTKCSIENVKKLNLWGCGIDDIQVCEKMAVLEILSLSVNEVKSLAPLQNCKNLKELYLRKNCVESLDELVHLKDLPNLRTLWIDENPCVGEGGPEYRRKVIQMLPNLTKLDDKPVTHADHQAPIEPECDLHMIYTPKSNRSSSIDLMSRSGPAVVDRVMPSQVLHFGDTSDDEKTSYSVDVVGVPAGDLMSQSVYGNLCATLAEEPSSADDEWNDFGLDDDQRLPPATTTMPLSARMYQSMHEGLVLEVKRASPAHTRSVSVPRRRITTSASRTTSTSPAREHRLTKIMSAVSVLLDELDADSLRRVVDEAQRRLKKQR